MLVVATHYRGTVESGPKRACGTDSVDTGTVAPATVVSPRDLHDGIVDHMVTSSCDMMTSSCEQ